MRYDVVCGLLDCTNFLFSTFCISGTIFLEVIEHKSASRFSLQRLSETFLILRRVERDIKSVYWSSCKVPIIQNFLDIFSKNGQISKFLKIRSVGAEDRAT